MNRRQFTQSLAALFAAPALPAKALLAAPAATTAAVAPPNLYTWSVMIARVHGKCSADMLTRMLQIDPAQASRLFSKMVANNVIGQANALGVSRAKAILPPQTGVQPSVPQPQSTPNADVRRVSFETESFDDREPVDDEGETERAEETPAQIQNTDVEKEA